MYATQLAAVRTNLVVTITPLQKCLLPKLMLTCQGQEFGMASSAAAMLWLKNIGRIGAATQPVSKTK